MILLELFKITVVERVPERGDSFISSGSKRQKAM